MGLIGTFFSFRAAHHSKAASRKLDDVQTPERAAAARVEGGPFAVLWVLFGCLALPSLGIAGASSLWWLVPIAAVLAVGHVATTSYEAELTPADRRRRMVSATTRARCTFDPMRGCTWCGSPAHHVDDHGRRLHPAVYHHDEVDAAIESQLAAEG